MAKKSKKSKKSGKLAEEPKKIELAEELKRIEYEPLLEVEKRLIAWSLILGLLLLNVFIWMI